MQDLIQLLDNNTDHLTTAAELFSIPVELHYTSDEDCGKSCAEIADEQTEPGALLLWEFNAYNRKHFFSDTQTVGIRVKKFVELLQRLEISTRYDCFDSYGSQSDDPETAIISQLMFEAESEDILYAKKVAIASELFTEEEFDEYYCLNESE